MKQGRSLFLISIKMKKVLVYAIFLSLIYLNASCTFNNVNLNKKEDDIEGQKFLVHFYSKVAGRNYSDIDSLVSDSLKSLADTNGISKMVKFINNKVGNYKGYAIDDCYIIHVAGTEDEVSYNYKLKVRYDKGVIEEIIGFRSKDGLKLLINSYHANSDLLIR